MDARPARSSIDLNLSTLERTPGFLIRIVQIQIFESFYEHFDQVGLSPAQHTILMAVRDNPSITQTELAGVLKIQLPNLVKILGAFEDQGVLKRSRSKRDRRAVELKLTVRGVDLARRSARLADEFNERTLARLRPGEREEFMTMLVRLAAPHPIAKVS